MSHAESETPLPCGVPFGSALQAPVHWRHIDFISDLHLQASEPAIFESWSDFMLRHRPTLCLFWVTCLRSGWAMTLSTPDRPPKIKHKGLRHVADKSYNRRPSAFLSISCMAIGIFCLALLSPRLAA